MFAYKKFWKQYLISQKFTKSIMKRHSRFTYVTLATILLICSASIVFVTVLPSSPKTFASAESSTTLLQETNIHSNPQFNVTVIYAYAGLNNYTSKELNSTFNGIPMHPASLYPDIIYFNFTHVSNAENAACDAKIEVYLIQISADTGAKESYTCFFGTNYNTSYSQASLITPAISEINELINTSATKGVSGIFNPNMDTNQSLWFKVGSLDTTTSQPSRLGLWSAGEPNSITVSIQRIGWVALNGTVNSIISASPEDSAQVLVSLTKSGQGFLYNTIPQDDLLPTDVFHPIALDKPLK
jgi:hypothetical protein